MNETPVQRIERLANAAYTAGKIRPKRFHFYVEHRQLGKCGCAIGAAVFEYMGFNPSPGEEVRRVYVELGATEPMLRGIIDGFDDRDPSLEPEKPPEYVEGYEAGRRLAAKWLNVEG